MTSTGAHSYIHWASPAVSMPVSVSVSVSGSSSVFSSVSFLPLLSSSSSSSSSSDKGTRRTRRNTHKSFKYFNCTDVFEPCFIIFLLGGGRFLFATSIHLPPNINTPTECDADEWLARGPGPHWSWFEISNIDQANVDWYSLVGFFARISLKLCDK